MLCVYFCTWESPRTCSLCTPAGRPVLAARGPYRPTDAVFRVPRRTHRCVVLDNHVDREVLWEECGKVAIWQ
eukprot:48127-Eustigmatos_ZCMA.PRE.1